MVRLGEMVSRLGAVSAFALFVEEESFDFATPTPAPPRKGEGRARSILKTIPFSRLRLVGDDSGCQTLPVMAGPVPAIHAFNLRKRRGCPAQGRA